MLEPEDCIGIEATDYLIEQGFIVWAEDDLRLTSVLLAFTIVWVHNRRIFDDFRFFRGFPWLFIKILFFLLFFFRIFMGARGSLFFFIFFRFSAVFHFWVPSTCV